jgi:hypothetical protein
VAVLRIDERFVRTWSTRYLEGMSADERTQEERLFQRIGPAVRAQGSFTRKQFLEVAEWKSARSKGLYALNTESVVREITRLALGSSVEERLTTLTVLQGVQDAVASALLTVWSPETYTVTDWRALATLTRAGKFRATKGRAPYGLYLAVCRSIADGLDIEAGDASRLRLLDRALWKYSQAHD